jgi:hypothetical protein
MYFLFVLLVHSWPTNKKATPFFNGMAFNKSNQFLESFLLYFLSICVKLHYFITQLFNTF